MLHASETVRMFNHALPAGNLPRAGTGEPLMEVEEDQGTGLKSDSIPLSMFSCPGAAGFKVRGPNYLQDKKKVVLFWLCSVYFVSSKEAELLLCWLGHRHCLHFGMITVTESAFTMKRLSIA